MGETLEAKVVELTDALTERTSERDTMAGQLAVRTSEWEEGKARLAAATQRAVDAEKAAAAAAAHLEGERSARAGLEAQVAQMQRRLHQLESDAARAAAAEATAAGLREQLALLGSTNAMLRTLVPKGAEG
jgi:chromosome segregation ATPase